MAVFSELGITQFFGSETRRMLIKMQLKFTSRSKSEHFKGMNFSTTMGDFDDALKWNLRNFTFVLGEFGIATESFGFEDFGVAFLGIIVIEFWMHWRR